MRFVPKVPMRPDFCGCPPCPLCFDIVDDAGGRVDGFESMVRSLAGKGSEELAPEARAELEGAAESIHAANLARAQDPDAALREADRRQHLERQLAQGLRDARIATKRPQQRAAGATLDELLDAGAIDEDDFEEAVDGGTYVNIDMNIAAPAFSMSGIMDMITAYSPNPFAVPSELFLSAEQKLAVLRSEFVGKPNTASTRAAFEQAVGALGLPDGTAAVARDGMGQTVVASGSGRRGCLTGDDLQRQLDEFCRSHGSYVVTGVSESDVDRTEKRQYRDGSVVHATRSKATGELKQVDVVCPVANESWSNRL